ncbi:hypothetical protein ABGT16_01720 [Pseudomonas asiatica]|uniref:hypothetical protein n=1 Tax=Pseudomonas asiatica TaxID=2219225 RepID=UPI00345CFFFB
MTSPEKEETPLKKTMNPKDRGNFTELKGIKLDSLSEREKILYRVINELEEQLNKPQK